MAYVVKRFLGGINSHRLRYSLLSFFSLAVCYAWLMTSTGLYLTLHGLCYFASDAISIEGLTGYLAGPVHIKRITVKSSSYQSMLTDLSIEWKKSALLWGTVQVKRLSLKSAHFVSHASSDRMSRMVWPSWLQLTQLDLTTCDIVTKDWSLEATGGTGPNRALKWRWTGDDLRWEGELKLVWNREFSLELLAHSVPIKKREPTDSVASDAISRAPKDRLVIDASNQTLDDRDYIAIRCSELSSFASLRKAKTLWWMKGRLKEPHVLEYLRVIPKASTLPANNLRIEGHLEGSLHQLVDCIQPPYWDSLQQHLGQKWPIPFRCSLNWSAPSASHWGAFNQMDLEGSLHSLCVLWKAQLSQQNTAKSSKWQVSGDTRWSVARSKTRPSPLNVTSTTHINVQGDPVTFFSGTDYELEATPKLNVDIDNHRIKVSGHIDLPSACFKLGYLQPDIKPNPDIYVISKANSPNTPLKRAVELELDLALGKAVYLQSAGLSARLAGSLSIDKRSSESATTRGEINMVEGDYYCFGQTLQLDPNSRLIFTHRLDDPTLDIAASRPVALQLHQPSSSLDATLRSKKPHVDCPLTDMRLPLHPSIGVYLRGSLQHPSMQLLLTPKGQAVPAIDGLSYLITGQPANHADAVSFLISTVTQLGNGYLGRYGLYPALYQPLGMRVDVQSEKVLDNTYLILSKPLTSQLTVLAKVGLRQTDYPLSVNYAIGQHATLGASWHTSRKVAALEIAHQYEWD